MRILCVCTGNTCRSPMFQVLLTAALGRAAAAITVESAGTVAVNGDPASAGAQAAMTRRGLSLANHRSRALAGLDLAVFDHIYAVSSRHAVFIRAQGVLPARLHVLATEQGGISDPFGGDDVEYEACARQLANEAARIAREVAPAPPGLV